MEKKQIVLIVAGSVAVYKAVGVASDLTGRGYDVHPVLTEAATHFVRPLQFQSVTGQRAYSDMWETERAFDVLHVSLADRADLVLAAPATAALIGRWANGIAEDLASCVLLAAAAPIIVAPAMNDRMWAHPSVQANIETLRRMGVHIIEPETGRLACGREGQGRLASVDRIVQGAREILEGRGSDAT